MLRSREQICWIPVSPEAFSELNVRSDVSSTAGFGSAADVPSIIERDHLGPATPSGGHMYCGHLLLHSNPLLSAS